MTTLEFAPDQLNADEPTTAPAWRNLIIAKSGLTYGTDMVYASEQRAREVAEWTMATDKECIICIDGPEEGVEIWYGSQPSGIVAEGILKTDVLCIVQVPCPAGEPA